MRVLLVMVPRLLRVSDQTSHRVCLGRQWAEVGIVRAV